MTRHPVLRARSVLYPVAAALLIGITLSTAPAKALSADGKNASGIMVSPARVDMTLGESGSIQSQLLSVVNNYNVPVHMSAQFSGIDENAGLLVPLGEPDDNLAPTLALSETDIVLAPHGVHQLTVQVTNESHLSPGGHYATLLLTPDIALPGGQTVAPAGQLPLRASLSVNLFIVKSQGAQVHLGLESLSTNQWLFKLPTEAKLGFINQGNIHGVPRATVTVLAADGKQELVKGVANQASLPLLPGKHLLSVTPLTSLAHTWKPQKVTVTASYRFDGSDEVQNYSHMFWYVPPVWLAPLIIPLVVAGWVLWRPLGSVWRSLRVLWLLLLYTFWSWLRLLFKMVWRVFRTAIHGLQTFMHGTANKAAGGLRDSRQRRRASKRVKSLKRQAAPPTRPSGRPYGIVTAGKQTKKAKKVKKLKKSKKIKKLNTSDDKEISS